jgi:hypothetical protein
MVFAPSSVITAPCFFTTSLAAAVFATLTNKISRLDESKSFISEIPITLTNLNKPIISSKNDYAELDIGFICKKESNKNNFINFFKNLEDKIKSDATFEEFEAIYKWWKSEIKKRKKKSWPSTTSE